MITKKDQENASHIIRERIELISDPGIKFDLHREYCAFLVRLNNAIVRKS